jgi:hypothetical protein
LKRYKYVEPGDNNEPVEVILTEKEILDFYYDYWSMSMDRIGKNDEISKENCIIDFCIVHWAVEVK